MRPRAPDSRGGTTMSSERTFYSPTRCTSSDVPVGCANRQGGSADMRDRRTHHELADKEFSTATCGNVVGAPSVLTNHRISIKLRNDQYARITSISMWPP